MRLFFAITGVVLMLLLVPARGDRGNGSASGANGSATRAEVAIASSWTPVAIGHGPTTGSGPLTYDATDGYLLLYESYVASTGHGPACGNQELWSFVHGGWSQLPSTSAPKFDTALMTYDSNDGYTILFGGCGTQSNQTWTYRDGQWANVTLAVAPPAREAGSLAYDPSSKSVVLFGGYVYFNLSNGAGYRSDDTWEFQGGAWRNVTASLTPPARDLYGMSSDGTDGYVVLFGGSGAGFHNATSGSCCPTLSDTWTFRGGEWTNVTTSIGPSPRTSPAFADDPASHASILFGGQDAGAGGMGGQAGLLSNAWRYSAGTWQNLTIGGNPPARAGADRVYDPIDGSLVLFGGESPSTLLNDTWELNASLGTASSAMPVPSGTILVVFGAVAVAVAVVAVVVLLWRRKRTRPPSLMVGSP
jgi:hypothetical protein